MMRKALAIAAVFGITAMALPALAETSAKPLRTDVHWSFEGPFGRFNQEQLQRGYKVYHEVCSACHSMNLLSYRNLGQKGGPFYVPGTGPNDNPYVKTIVKDYQVPDIDTDTGDTIKRPATAADAFVKPFPNQYAAAAAYGGAAPPDLSLMAKARENGPRYIFSLLTGYIDPPAGLNVPVGRYYNPYFPSDLGSAWTGKGPVPTGGFIAMPFQLLPNRVSFDDGVQATTDQEAKDVVAFLVWAAEPHADERKDLGLAVMIYLLIFTGILYVSYRTLWRNIDH